MNTNNIVMMLEKLADLLAIEGSRVLLSDSYRKAAASIREGMPTTLPASEFYSRIMKIPGISSDVAGTIVSIARGRHPNILDLLVQNYPLHLADLLRLPGLGPRRVNLLYNELGIDSIEKLHAAIENGEIQHVPGFGPVLERRLLQAIRRHTYTLLQN